MHFRRKLTLVSKLKFNIFLTVLAVIFCLQYRNEVTIEEAKNHLILYSTFYYETSKFYSPNSMILLINAHANISTSEVSLQCVSQNQTSTLNTFAQIRVADFLAPGCEYEFFIINCSTVTKPDYFNVLSLKGAQNLDASMFSNIPFEVPIKETLPVVMCYPPMVYESRWQQIIFAIEIYHFYGTDAQVHYVNSVQSQIYELLKVYESKGIIRIQKFYFPDFDAETIASIGVHPMHSVNFRNQPLALTDCLMRYRESAEFIIIGDIDDVFFPPRKSYFAEFSHWKSLHPMASAFTFYRTPAVISFADNFKKFSLQETVKSLTFTQTPLVGKSVYQPQNVETAWIHWPGLNNATAVEIPFEEAQIFHVKRVPFNKSLPGYVPFKKVSDIEISNLSKTFNSTFANFPEFQSNLIYAVLIKRCYDESTLANGQPKPCLSPLNSKACKLPTFVEDYSCRVVKRQYSKKIIGNHLIMHIPKGISYWEISEHGCNIFQQ